MLYRLVNSKKQSPWQVEYERLYQKYLKIKPRDISIEDLESGKVIVRRVDTLWIMHYEDLNKQAVIDCPAYKITQANGTAANPYCYQVDREEELKTLSHIDKVLVFNQEMKEALTNFFGVDKFEVIGFPVEVNIPPKKKKKQILVSGRISPDKQFYLATFLLANLKKDYKVIFTFPKGEDKWKELYDIDRFGIEYKQCSRDEYLEILAESEFYFTCSLGDISSVSLVEALFLGCYPVIPQFTEPLPVYDDYVSIGYEPFSRRSVENLIKKKPDFTWDSSMSNPELCARRLENMLRSKKR